jgi:hypothetical protein
MMLDADVVAVSPSSIYRVLRDAKLMERRNTKSSLKGTGFQQPLVSHEHWHWRAPKKLVQRKWESLGSINCGGTYEKAMDRRGSDSLVARIRSGFSQRANRFRHLSEARDRRDDLLSVATETRS